MVARRLVLASGSKARLALLRTAGFAPEVVVSDVDEDGVDDLPIGEAVRALAERKARAVASRLTADEVPAVIVGCDSMLSIDGETRGKPTSIDQARSWWRGQRGHKGTLASGHCVIDMATNLWVAAVAETEVRFGDPSDAEIEAYLATGEALHVAGGFTIDGYAAPFVDRLDGDHGNVLGLSLPLLRSLLAELDIAVTDLWAPQT
jgi:septum formation protein